MPPLRRSARLRGLHATTNAFPEELSTNDETPPSPTRLKSSHNDSNTSCLPRKREEQILLQNNARRFVLGVDEAGRGPLAGPVVAAAIHCPQSMSGIVDSKCITQEVRREALYEALVSLPDCQWAVAVISAQRIDEINILQATLEGMRCAVQALVDPSQLLYPIVSKASVDLPGCYVVSSPPVAAAGARPIANPTNSSNNHVYVLVDGNKVPPNLPCEAEAMVKGDGREYSIAAASILAKVTRDRLMHDYHVSYPAYNLIQHKGYPTQAHMQAIQQHGACPIHRRTFAPLKHMVLDDKGRIVGQREVKKKK